MTRFADLWANRGTVEALELLAAGRRFLVDVALALVEQAQGPLEHEERVRVEHEAYERPVEMLRQRGVARDTVEVPVGQGCMLFKSLSSRSDSLFDRVLISPWEGKIGHLSWSLAVRLQYERVDEERLTPGEIACGVFAWAALDGQWSYARGNPTAHPRIWALLSESGVLHAVDEAWASLGVTGQRLDDFADRHLMYGALLEPGDGQVTESLQDRCVRLLLELWDRIPAAPPITSGQPAPEGQPPEEGEPPEDSLPTGMADRLCALLRARGFHYSAQQLAALYGALRTKGFVILAGLSGTGKSRIIRELASVLGLDDGRHLLLVPVRPDWRDPSALLGYYNPLLERYEATPFVHFVLDATEEYARAAEPANGPQGLAAGDRDGLPARKGQARPYFVILDEMNLARVEYYFADLLSVLESGRFPEGEQRGFTCEALRLHTSERGAKDVTGRVIPGKLHLPPNLFIVGTVNMDETTFSFSPKVLDRAFTLEFNDADLSNYPPEIVTGAAREHGSATGSGHALPEKDVQALMDGLVAGGAYGSFTKADVVNAHRTFPWIMPLLRDLQARLRPHDLHFGYRVVDEILVFVQRAHESPLSEALDPYTAFDVAVRMKVLPKFHGPLHRMEAPLNDLQRWAQEQDPPCRHVAAKVEQMLRRLRDTGHTYFL